MQGTASSFLTDVNKILKELYTGEYTVEKTAEEIDSGMGQRGTGGVIFMKNHRSDSGVSTQNW